MAILTDPGYQDVGRRMPHGDPYGYSVRHEVLGYLDPERISWIFLPAHDALAFAPLGARVGRAPAMSGSGSISSGCSTCRTGMPCSRSAWLIMAMNSAMAEKSPSYTSWYRPSAL